jgi:hypothetical protein
MTDATRWLQWVSLPISVLALVIAGYQSWDAHTSATRALQPLLVFDTEDDPEEAPFGLTVENDGAGPAIIKTVTYYVDKKPVASGDPDDVIKVAKLNSNETNYQEIEPNDAVGVGQHISLFFRGTRYKADGTEADRFADFLDDHLEVKIEYQSLSGESFIKCATPHKFDDKSIGCPP